MQVAQNHVDVFHSFGPYYRILNIYESDNFRNADQRVILWNLGRAFVYTVLVIGIILALIAQCWLCYDCNFELGESASIIGDVLFITQLIISQTAIARNKHRVYAIIETLQQTIQKRCERSTTSLTIFAKIEKRFEFFVSFAIKYSIVVTLSFCIVPFVVPIFYLFFGFPKEHFPEAAQFEIPLPSDINPFFKHYFNLYHQSSCCIMLYIMFWTPTLFFIGMCLYITGMREDIQTILTESADGRSANERFIEAIVFHNGMLDFAKTIGDLLSIGLFFQLLSCAASLAICMVGLQKSDMRSMNFLLALAILAVTLASAFTYCYLSERVTTALSEIDTVFYDMPWYELTVKQQKLFTLTIQRAQKEFRLTGLGLVDCSLRVFGAIVRTAWSYFLIMRG